MSVSIKGITAMQPLFVKYPHIFVCPACRGDLAFGDREVNCNRCQSIYQVHEGIPLLFDTAVDATQSVTDVVKAFYEENPFPNYDDCDSEESLITKARQGMFAKLLDEQIPQGALVLEAGCGTGQLTNFLGMHWNRAVFGSDMCVNSLLLGERFRQRCDIKNSGFLQMNLFRPAFREEVFDVVICNGVLHHTNNPLGGFRALARLIKPKGFIIIGLYNRIARLTTDLRRVIFRVSRDRFQFLDSHLRNRRYNKPRKRAWFMDQYKHPHESKHSYDEVLSWFEGNGFRFVFSIPTINGSFDAEEQLFAAHDEGTKVARIVTQIEMLLQGGSDGGLFIMIGQKVQQPRLRDATIDNTSSKETPARA
jgi:SAM-dependent methyltransferase